MRSGPVKQGLLTDLGHVLVVAGDHGGLRVVDVAVAHIATDTHADLLEHIARAADDCGVDVAHDAVAV